MSTETTLQEDIDLLTSVRFSHGPLANVPETEQEQGIRDWAALVRALDDHRGAARRERLQHIRRVK